MEDSLEDYLGDTTGAVSVLVAQDAAIGVQHDTVEFSGSPNSLADAAASDDPGDTFPGQKNSEKPLTSILVERATSTASHLESTLHQALEDTTSTMVSPMPLRSRGPLSPFSPPLRANNASGRTQSTVSWDTEKKADLSLAPCRTVSVVVRVHVPQKLKQKRLCLFPLVSETITTPPSDMMSPISATMKAASATETKDLVLVNPSAFGKFIPGEVTIETARLVANVANIETEDWARRYRFDEVVWPSLESSDNSLAFSAFAKLAHSLANDGVIRQQSSLCMGMGAQGSGRTATMFGSAAYQRQGDVTPERYGLLGLTFAALLEHLPEDAVCTLSILEIVDEDTLRDLLSDDPVGSQSHLRVRHPDNKGATVQNLSDVPLDSLTGLEHLTRKAFHSVSALRARKREGAPGHVLTTINVWQNGAQFDLANGAKCTSLQFVDLASGEDGPARLDARSTRRMASFRNSVSALRGVLRGLLLREAGETASRAISYRECTLTKLLQRPLEREGNRSVIVVAASASTVSYERTLHTLDYANRLLSRPGKTAQSTFSSSYHRDQDKSTSRQDNCFEQLGSNADSDELLKNVLSDPRQRLAKLMKKPTPSPSAKKVAPAPVISPRKLDLDETRGERSGDRYEPYDYMEIDPGSVATRHSPAHLRESLENEPALKEEYGTVIDPHTDLELFASEETALEQSFASVSSDWLDNEAEDVLSDQSPSEREVKSTAMLAGTHDVHDVLDDNAVGLARRGADISDRFDDPDSFRESGHGHNLSLSVSTTVDKSSDTRQKDEWDTDVYLHKPRGYNKIEQGQWEESGYDESDPFNLAVRQAESADSFVARDGSRLLDSAAKERARHIQGPDEHLLENFEDIGSSSDISGLRSDIADLSVQDDARSQVRDPKVDNSDTDGNKSLLHSYLEASREETELFQVDTDANEADESGTCPTHPLSASTTSRRSVEAIPQRYSEVSHEHVDTSPLQLSVNQSVRTPIDSASHTARYVNEIENLACYVDQIRHLHSGLWRSSSLSIEKLRSYEQTQQSSLEEAERARSRVESEVCSLQKVSTRQVREYEEKCSKYESESTELESRLDTAIRDKNAMEIIAEEAIAAQDKLEHQLTKVTEERNAILEQSESRISKYEALAGVQTSTADELEATARELLTLRADHSRCEKIIAALRNDLENLSNERDRLEQIGDHERGQLEGYADLKTEHSILLDQHKSCENELSVLHEEKKDLSSALSKHQADAAKQDETQKSRISSLEREMSSLELELATARKSSDEDAATADALIRELKDEISKLRIDSSHARLKQVDDDAALSASRRAADDASAELSRTVSLLASRDEELTLVRKELAAIQTEYEKERTKREEKEEALRSFKGDAKDKLERLLAERKKILTELKEHEYTIRDTEISTQTARDSLQATLKERNSLESNLLDTRRQLDDARRILSQTEMNSSDLQARLEKSKSGVQVLRADVQSLRSLKPSLADLRSQVHDERLKCSQEEANSDALKSQLEDRDNRLQSTNKELEALRSMQPRLDYLTARVDEESQGRADAEQKSAAAHSRLLESEAQLETAHTDIAALKTAHSNVLDSVREQLDKERQAKSQADVTSQSLQSQLEASEIQLESARQKIDELLATQQARDNEVEEIVRQERMLRSQTDLSSETVRSSLKESEDQRESLTRELDALQASHQRTAEGLRDEINKEQLARSQAESDVAELQSQLQESHQQLESLRQEMDTLALSHATRERAAKELAHEERLAQVEESDRQLDALRLQLRTAEAAQQKSEQSVQTMASKEQLTTSQAESAIASLVSDLQKSEGQRASLRRELDEIRTSRQANEKETQELERTAKRDRSEAQSTITRLQSQLEQSSQERESLRHALDALQASEQTKESEAHDIARKERLARNQADSTAQLLRSQLEEHKQQLESLRQELENLETSQREKAQDAKKLVEYERRARAEADSRAQSMRSQLEESEKQRESSRRDIDALESSQQAHVVEIQELLHKEQHARKEAESRLQRRSAERERQSESLHHELETRQASQRIVAKGSQALPIEEQEASAQGESIEDEIRATIRKEQQARTRAESAAESLQMQLEESERQRESLRRDLNVLQSSPHVDDVQELVRTEQRARHEAEANAMALRSALSDSRRETEMLQTGLQSLSSSAGFTEHPPHARDQFDLNAVSTDARLIDTKREVERMRSDLRRDGLPETPSARRSRDAEVMTEAEALLMRQVEADERERRQLQDRRQSRTLLDFPSSDEETNNLKRENSVLRLRLLAATNKGQSQDDDVKRDWSRLTIDRLRTEKTRAEEIAASLAAQTKRVVENRNEEVMHLKGKLSHLAEEKESEITVLRARLLALERQARWTVSDGFESFQRSEGYRRF